ncbi:hypothetical protein L3049_18440 [Labilibaculum sp. DW002]|uniref:Uncharacterized protein n=1 Tax=Paralabilibaculum antarcticum TaxID=2912572 RepID=A0ABT5VXD6_9BACT|nr:hypothetical protein [Labilibaculum sp. DW002]MDE5419972.1 hypothetical protein [Labilibaculum sp. DW002]
MKAQIQKYKIEGKVYTWTYKNNPRNYPAWNFTVDLKACESISALLNLMNNCEWSSKKTISIKLPTESQVRVPNNKNGTESWKSKTNLILSCKTSESTDYWKIIELNKGIEIQFGKAKLIEFQNAINEIPKRSGDFAISDQNEENILYLWWNLDE